MNVMKSKVDVISTVNYMPWLLTSIQMLWIQEFDAMNLHPNGMSFLYNLKGEEYFIYLIIKPFVVHVEFF